VTLHHRLDGQEGAPPLLLCNSLGTTLEMWDPQVPALATRFRLVRYDQRGHGRSAVPPGPYAIDDLGTDALALLDELEIARASFCGLSIGGMVGMWLAAEAPERVHRLVLCCTAPVLPPREQWLERAATVRAHGVSAIADATLGRWFTPAAPETLRETFRAMLVATPAEGYASCCEALADLDLRDRLAEIEAPTLAVTGAEDPVAPPETGERLAASIAGARHVTIAGARHIANAEQPSTFTQHVLAHLTEETR
jgi:3-oxoadipate enol-lactonase